MAGSDLAALYGQGDSIPKIAAKLGLPRSRVRGQLLALGVKLRSRSEGVRLAMPSLDRSAPRGPMSEAGRANISTARNSWCAANARGWSLKPSGYVEYTRGPHKGRSVHVVAMEQRLGRALLSDEVVHHIDGDRQNNKPDNLALMTRAGHTRLHRREQTLQRGEH